MKNMANEITEFYEGTNILITGGTGFFGKVLVQKLLRSIKNITIYLIIRPKKNLCVTDRLKLLFEDALFDTLKEEYPDFLSRIKVVEGDVSCKSLNLSEKSLHILRENINVVFHCAANLSMNENMKEAVNTNVRGTYELVELCRTMRNLQSVMIVSTAYANSIYPVIEEKYYECSISPELLIKLCEELDDDIVESIEDRLTGRYANKYCYTKAVSERIISKASKEIPVGTFRPSIVTSTYKDPIPGWTDNTNGALGVAFAMLLGVMRVGQFKLNTKADMIPVDMCVNALICSTWDLGEKWAESKEDLVYNFTNNSNKITWKRFRKLLLEKHKYAFNNTVWAPFLITCENKLTYFFLSYLFHTVPAYICDLFLLLMKKKQRFGKIHKNVSNFHNVIAFFNQNEWDIVCKNTEELWRKMSSNAKSEFSFHPGEIDEDAYFESMTKGIKQYFLKEDMTNSEQSEKALLRFKLIHRITKYTLLILSVILCLMYYNILQHFGLNS